MNMNTKNFKGKAIYNPSGKAGEYSYWACNFYVGCSNGCTYCYCKKGILAGAMGGETPKLKSCFKDENHALEIFEKELKANSPELQTHGLFFSFTTDPMLPETIGLTTKAMNKAVGYFAWDKEQIKVKILTKQTQWLNDKDWKYYIKGDKSSFWFDLHSQKVKHSVAIGFTLTGHDDLEPNASTNAERIKAMRKLHKAGFKTWASIEPVIDIKSSREVIKATNGFCDLYKIGLLSGKTFDRLDLRHFVVMVSNFTEAKIYFKDSLLKQAGINRSELPSNCVGRDYSLFND